MAFFWASCSSACNPRGFPELPSLKHLLWTGFQTFSNLYMVFHPKKLQKTNFLTFRLDQFCQCCSCCQQHQHHHRLYYPVCPHDPSLLTSRIFSQGGLLHHNYLCLIVILKKLVCPKSDNYSGWVEKFPFYSIIHITIITS